MKRIFLCAFVSSLFTLAAFAAAKQPNILFIFSDDHAYQAISAYNDPRKLLQTPNLDRIAKEGMLFTRAMVPNSICGPSRATVLTGKYNHLNGFYNNSNSKFDPSQPTFVKDIHAAGYQTAVIGKWHLISDPVGFDYWKILPGQGVYYNPAMIDNGKPVKLEGYTTDLITDLTLDWLKSRDKSKPFLMMCYHKAPHREWEPNLKNLGWDNDRKHVEPETLFDDYANRGLAVRDQDMSIEKTFTLRDAKLVTPGQLTPEQKGKWDAYYEPRNAKFRAANLTGKDLVRWRYQRYMHDYLGCIKSVDESVGRLLDYLKAEGLDKDTIVVYSADQGFYLGEHGWFDKRWIFEESLRTPLLVRWPGVTKPGSVNHEIVSNLDFAETFLDAAGLPVPKDMQGHSLRPLLAGQTPADWRKSFYYHYYEYPTPHHVRPHEGVVTDQFKLVHFYKPDVDYWELYDRKKDPNEMRDYSKDPAYAEIVAQLTQEMSRLKTELKFPAEIPRSAYGNKAFDNEPQAPDAAPKKKGGQKKKKAE
ncbi:MAG: sulfatase [Verrucomicrobia bacterium]|nr:sulfatase [Verrucomicrobiota bacterium]